jgi:DNA-binding GntR family transcriptional regulator
MTTDPMYRKIAESLRQQIEAGVLGPGTQLPTEIELREHYDASRNTVRDAIKWLTSLGLVETRPGQGTFVVRKADPFVTTLSADPKTGFGGGEGATYLSEVGARHRTPKSGPLKVELKAAPTNIALRLRVKPDSQLIVRHQERFIDEVPWSLQTSFYPMEFATAGHATQLLMAQDIGEGTVKYLEKTMRLKQVGYRDWITARTPDQNEMVFFGISHDSTVFEIFRTAFDQNSRPMRVTVTVFPTDRNQFILNVGDVPEPEYEFPSAVNGDDAQGTGRP